MTVHRGERVSLIGSNGAGKTTLVNMVTGYLKPDDGRIGFDGRDITALAPRAITRLGVARSFQIPQLYGDLTVLDNMLVANACHDQRLSFWQPAQRAEAIDRAERLLERFRLGEHRGRRVAELPGGVRKLLDIAMALTGAPKLLLLDEPGAGLTEQEAGALRRVIGSVHAFCGAQVLLIDHDVDLIAATCTQTLVLDFGRRLALGPTRAVLDDPAVRKAYLGTE
jgi:branched-chain amino acid transport system ATP-binding protein